MKHWAKEDEELLIKLMNQQKSLIGDNISQAIRNIEEEFPNRTFSAIRTKWDRIQKKLKPNQSEIKGLTESINEEKKERKVSEIAIVSIALILIVAAFFILKFTMG